MYYFIIKWKKRKIAVAWEDNVVHAVFLNGSERKVRRRFRDAERKIKPGIRNSFCGYLKGKPGKIKVKYVLEGVTPLQKKILKKTATIPYGSTMAYSDLAASLGNPNLTRAIATAMAVNPLPLLIPCHRVTAKNGPGGFMGKKRDTTGWKHTLMELEGSVGQ